MIPKIIQLHWFGEKWPIWAQYTLDTYKDMMPDWNIHIYRQIPDDLPMEYYEAMQRAPTMRLKADLIRWWLLYRDGGMYVDMDTRPLKTFEGIRNKKTFFQTLKGKRPDIFWVGTEPGRQLFIDALEGCKNAESGPRASTWFWIGNVLPDVANYEGVEIFPSSYVYHTTAEETKNLCDGESIKMPSGDYYMLHFRNFVQRQFTKHHVDLYAEQPDAKEFLQSRKPRIVSERQSSQAIPKPQPSFHKMPNGDLVVDPGGIIPEEPPEGYERDPDKPYRFHLKSRR